MSVLTGTDSLRYLPKTSLKIEVHVNYETDPGIFGMSQNIGALFSAKNQKILGFLILSDGIQPPGFQLPVPGNFRLHLGNVVEEC